MKISSITASGLLFAVGKAATISELTLQIIDKTYTEVDLNDILLVQNSLPQMLSDIGMLQTYVADPGYNTTWPISRFVNRLTEGISAATTYERDVSSPEAAQQNRDDAWAISAAFLSEHWDFGEFANQSGMNLGGVQAYGFLTAMWIMFGTEEIFSWLAYDAGSAAGGLYYHNLYLRRAMAQFVGPANTDETGVETTFPERLQTWAEGVWRTRRQERIRSPGRCIGDKTISYYLEHKEDDMATGEWEIDQVIGHCSAPVCEEYSPICKRLMNAAGNRNMAIAVAGTVAERKDLIFGEHYDEIVAKFQVLLDRGRPSALDGIEFVEWP